MIVPIIRGIFILLGVLRQGIVGGFFRVVSSMVAYKTFSVFFFGIIQPILLSVIMLKMQGYILSYVLDYVNSHYDLSETFPVVLQLTGIAAYLGSRLGLDVALNMIVTAATIRFALSLSLFRGK